MFSEKFQIFMFFFMAKAIYARALEGTTGH